MRYLLNRYHGRMAARYSQLALLYVNDFHTWRGFTAAARRHAAAIR